MSDRRSEADDHAIRLAVYERIQLDPIARAELEQAIAASPGRTVGRGALRNVVSLTTFGKSSRPLLSESHSVEFIRLLECELDPGVVSIYTQVPISGVQRILPNGRRHVSGAHLDLLIFHVDRIEAEECKSLGWLREQVAKGHQDWSTGDGRYIHGPYLQWALARGIHHSIWAPPEHSARYRANLLAMHHVLTSELSERFLEHCKEIMNCLPENGTRTASSILKEHKNASTRHLTYLLATRQMYAPIISRRIEEDSIPIGRDAKTIAALDQYWLDGLAIAHSEPFISDSFHMCSDKARDHAIKRLKRIQEMRDDKIPWSRQFKALDKVLQESRESSELSVLVPRYRNCGNRVPRVSSLQQELVIDIAKRWENGEFAKMSHALAEFLLQAELQKTPPVSRTTLYAALKATNPERRALKSGGMRGYQSQARRSEPLHRTEPVALAGHTVHIDSTPFDVKGLLDLGDETIVDRGYITVARDIHGMCLALAITLGKLRTQSVALLYRDYVFRHGELPTVVFCDRGPENQNKWHAAFAQGRFHLSFAPTAGSKFNSAAEDLLNHINNDVYHWMKGNTLADRWGRAVDGRFKSVRTACLALPQIFMAAESYLFEDIPDTPNSEGISFRSDYLARRDNLGTGGQPCEMNDDLLIATSIPRQKYEASEKSGIRLSEGYFLNHQMQRALRTNKPCDVRSDCVDPSLVWVKVRDLWFKAHRSDASHCFDLTVYEQVARHWAGPVTRALRRMHREEAAKRRRAKARRDLEHVINIKPGMAQAIEQKPSTMQSAEEAYPEADITSLDEYEDL